MTLTRTPLLALALTATLAACGSEPSAVTAPTAGPFPAGTSSSTSDAASAPTVLATGLEAPWGLAFLPDGDALVTERDSARVLQIPAAGGEPTEVTRLTMAEPRGEGGLLGIAVSPTFATDNRVFAYVTTGQDNRIVSFRLSAPDEVQPVLTGIPKAGIHNGGRLAFGPDGMLYAGTGDTGDSSLSQDPRSLGGKVLRMTPEGRPAPGASSLVFSRGHRNVQGLAFDSSGQLYATEFGQNRFDEVNLITAGGNYGWPEVEGAGTGGGRFTAPVVVWETSEASPSGAAIVGDHLYVAALRGQRLWDVPLTGGDPVPLLQGEYGRLRAAAKAPDGALWILTSNRDGRGEPASDDDRVLRLSVS